MGIIDRFWKKIKANYSSGMCDVMAIAIARKYNKPLGVVRGFFFDETEQDEYYIDCHMVVIMEDNKVADSQGVRDLEEVLSLCVWDAKPNRIELIPVSEEEAMHCMTADGVTEEEINETMEDVPEL